MTRRAGIILAEVVSLAIVAALAAAGVIAWGLSGGRIEAGFLREPAEQVFARAFEGQRIDIGAIDSVWSPDEQSVVVTATDMVIRDAEGREQARAARLSAGLPALSLARRQFRPSRIEAEGGAFTLARGDDGRISFHLGPPDSMAIAPGAQPVIQDSGTTALAELRSLRLSGVTLYAVDDQNGVDWQIDGAALDYRQEGDGLSGSASGTLVQPGGGAALKAQASVEDGVRGGVFDLSIAGFNGAASGPARGPLAFLRLLDAPASAQARVTLEQSRLREVAMTAEAGAGRLLLTEEGSPLSAVALDLVYDAEAQRVVINGANIESERVTGAASGSVEGPDVEGGFAFDLVFDDPVVSFGGAFPQPPAARRIAARGVFDPAGRAASFDALDVEAGGVTGRFSGRAALPERADGLPLPELSLAGPIEGDATPADVLRYWPLDFAAGGRDWVADHVEAGRVHDAHLMLDLTPERLEAGVLPDDAMELSFRMDGARVRYLGDMPPLEDASGAAVLRGNAFSLTMEDGRIGDLSLRDGAVDIPRLAPRGGLARISATATGSAADMLALLDREPLNLSEAFGVDPATIGGQGELAFDIWRPMRRYAPPRRIGFDLRGSFEDVSAPGPAEGLDLSEGVIALTANPNGLTAEGTARIGPVEAGIAWRETFFSGDAPGTQFDLTAALDRDDFDALGVPMRAFLEGPVPVRVRTSGDGLQVASADVEADLLAADIVVGTWNKPAGVPGEARFTFLTDAETGDIRIENGEATAPGLEARARARLDSAARLLAAEIAPLRMETYADVDQIVAGRSGEALTVSVEGGYLNLSDLVAGLWQGAAGGLGAPLELDARLGELVIAPGAPLDDALLSFTHDGEAVTTLSLDAQTGGKAVRARLLPTGGSSRTLEASSDDAGLLFRTLFGADQVRGGRLTLTGASAAPDEPWLFDARMTNFTLVQAPILARILSLASFVGMAEALSGEGIGFAEFTTDAALDAGRLTLDGARATGPSLGLSADGDIDLGMRELALDGAIAPAALGNRVLGDILGAPQGEGLFAFEYTVAGPFSAADVVVNPLSGLAPGFLRRIFEGDQALPDPEPEADVEDETAPELEPELELELEREPVAP